MTEPDDKKKDLDLVAAGDESSQEEMEILKQVLEGKGAAAADDQLFSADLFAPAEDIKPAEPVSFPDPPPQKKEAPAAGIKIVTDDDLKMLFDDADSPAPAPETRAEPEPIEPPAEEPPPTGEPPSQASATDDQVTELDEAAPSAEEVEEIGWDDEPSPAETPDPEPTRMEEPEPGPEPSPEPSPEPPAERGLLEEISPDDIVENLEERAVVGEMTAVAAAKKGDLLEKTREMVSWLETSGRDYLSVAELKKLFSNVNILIELVTETAERLARIEDRVRELSSKVEKD